jgi:hypothetical protein
VLATLALTPAAATEPPPPPGTPVATGGLAGTLAFLDGAPIGGATVQIQARGVTNRGEAVVEQTLAQAQCDGEGRWSLPNCVVAAAAGVSLRALYVGAGAGAGGAPGAGAAVSAPLTLAASALSAAPVGAPTPAAAPAPAS